VSGSSPAFSRPTATIFLVMPSEAETESLAFS